jgi:anti-sigma regulatory factor (Ser/Thr protein kinase)
MKMPVETLAVAVIAKTAQWVTLMVPCQISCGEDAVRILQESELMSGVPLAAAEREKFFTALREVLWNAIEHGGQLDAAKQIRLDLVLTRRSLSCLIRDPGPGFQLPSIKHAAVNNPPEDVVQHALVRESQGMRPGGFGILMARTYVDELIYNEQGNEAALIRYLDAPSGL